MGAARRNGVRVGHRSGLGSVIVLVALASASCSRGRRRTPGRYRRRTVDIARHRICGDDHTGHDDHAPRCYELHDIGDVDDGGRRGY